MSLHRVREADHARRSRRWPACCSRRSTIAYPWYVLIGTTITLAVGILSLVHARRTGRRRRRKRYDFIVIGIDGGGSKTHAIVADEQGRTIGETVGPGSAVRPGQAEHSANVIADVVRDALASCEMTHVTPRVAVPSASPARAARRNASSCGRRS